ncbi:YegS/Rv2252/BmrU family lipid kinase [Gramella sp. AN32]|uniref:Diacylglycerol/lipid kinase family protein n=1 Tax=Christiangramia antarctica TaxID=2058158 RepID=A0ABW5XC58_9FLAO|nr:YegS/Rv2252/BmrU family lipid kinase [Gramella sp. AN32]MCM4156554.1 diacylglycerol kinase [Gramella sp. AN32]
MEEFKEVLLVVNPISGDLNKEEMIETVQREVATKGGITHVFETTGKNDQEKINKYVEDFTIDRILVAGGDGTINLVAEAVKDSDLTIGIIPAGSANGLAFNLNIPRVLKDQIEVALGKTSMDLDILCLNNTICLHMSDLGINAELIQNYENSDLRGKFGYLLQSIPTLIKSEFPFQFSIKTKNIEVEKEGILLCFANAKKYGTGANINPLGEPNDGIFEILVFKKFDIIEILKTLRNEVESDAEFVEVIQTTEAKVICKKPIAFQIDGEFIGKETEIDIKILPQKLRVAVPPSAIPTA